MRTSAGGVRRSERIRQRRLTFGDFERVLWPESSNTETAAVIAEMSDAESENGAGNAGQQQNPAMMRRQFFERNIRRQIDASPDDQIAGMTRVAVDDAIKKLADTFDKFELQHLSLVADLPQAQGQIEYNNYIEVDEIYSALMTKLRARQHEIMQAEEAERRQNAVGVHDNRPVQVTIESADPLANIREIWGQFHGDYSKWQDFRDLFKSGVHENERILPANKFKLLKRALKGAALRVVGSMLTTEANYHKAWEHLCKTYNDDYLAAQTVTKRLLAIEQLKSSSYIGLRSLCDTVHECTNQLASYFDIKGWDPLLVFIVVDRLDSETFGMWESKRLDFMREADEEAAGDVAAEMFIPCTVPPLKKLMDFLDQRVRIEMHKQSRSEVESSSASRSRDSSRDSRREINRNAGREQSQNRGAHGERNAAPDFAEPRPRGGNQIYPPCIIQDCRRNHGLYRCPFYMRMAFTEKESFVRDHNLCVVCLKEHGAGECRQDRKDCDRCGVHGLAHNSTLCKTREADRRTTLMSVVGNNPAPLSMNQADPNRVRRPFRVPSQNERNAQNERRDDSRSQGERESRQNE